MQKVTLANAATISHTFDAAGRETVLANRTSAGVALSIYSATYDNVGNRLTVLELDGTRVTYSYDSTYQLTNERRGGANAYNVTLSFDAVGNRLLKSDGAQLTTYSHNAANELTLITNPTGAPTTQSFDSNGTLTGINTGGALTTLVWDGENRLLTVSDSTGIVTSTYSAEGLRQKKVVGATTSLFLWDDNNIVQETNAGLIMQERYTDIACPYGPGIWGGKFAMHTAGVSSFLLPDHQGTTRQLINPSQTVSDTLLTDAWGRELATTGTTNNPFRAFGQSGYFRDTTSRLYVNARHLEPTSGRWLSRDPIGFWGRDANLYRYVANGPARWVDPLGLTQESWLDIGRQLFSGETGRYIASGQYISDIGRFARGELGALNPVNWACSSYNMGAYLRGRLDNEGPQGLGGGVLDLGKGFFQGLNPFAQPTLEAAGASFMGDLMVATPFLLRGVSKPAVACPLAVGADVAATAPVRAARTGGIWPVLTGQVGCKMATICSCENCPCFIGSLLRF